MNDAVKPSREEVARALDVVLARTRCKILHNQPNGGRCSSCISWAENIGTPEHLPRMMQTLPVRSEAVVKAEVEAERDRLRAQVARVEALAEEWDQASGQVMVWIAGFALRDAIAGDPDA